MEDSIADQIILSNAASKDQEGEKKAESDDGGYTDEFGVHHPLSKEMVGNVDYLAARAIYYNRIALENGTTNKQLYSKLDPYGDLRVYLGYKMLSETLDKVYLLTKADWSIPTYVQMRFWVRLKELLPRFSDKKIAISRTADGRAWLWDSQAGQLTLGPASTRTVTTLYRLPKPKMPKLDQSNKSVYNMTQVNKDDSNV